jgi:CDP-glycerol glycerophosphotransferase (TagB/SpsB family)
LLKLLKWILNLILGDIIYLISIFIPKDDNLWIFGSWYGEKYSDNSKYLFEYVNENHPEIRAIWLTKNDNVMKIINNKEFEVYKMNSIYAHILSLRAGFSIISQSVKADLNLFLSYKTKVVQLWHGTPLKKIYFDANPLSNSRKTKLFRFFFPYLKENFSILIAPSNEVKEKFSTAFNMELSKIKITGYPRNDGLFQENRLTNHIHKGIYLPTFRDNSEFDIFKYDFNLDEVENTLKRLDAHLYIQLHPKDYKNKNELENIIQKSNFLHYEEFDDLYSNLNQFDFLITDYSSVYFDYLLLDRPVIFAPFDYDTYLKQDRQFYYDYYSVTPGPKANSWKELLIYIEESIFNPKKYLKDISVINKIFNKYSDSKNSERVFKEIEKIKN